MNTETLVPLDMSDAIAMIKRQQQEIARLKMYQAVCHCGSLAMDHGLHDGHTAVPMEEPCPYVEQIATLEEINKNFANDVYQIAREVELKTERIATLTAENKRLRDRLKSHGDIETDKEEIAQAALGKEENDAEIYDTYTR